MEIILFWVLGALSLAAAGFAMLHARPARAATALSLAMAANGGICLVLGQYLLGLEVLLVLTAGALFLRAFLRGREILQIHTGGRPRWSLARVSGAAAAVAFLWLLLPLLSDLERPHPIESGDTFAAAWIALLALVSAGLTGAWIIHARRGQNGGPAT